jgi:hypothetical protein
MTALAIPPFPLALMLLWHWVVLLDCTIGGRIVRGYWSFCNWGREWLVQVTRDSDSDVWAEKIATSMVKPQSLTKDLCEWQIRGSRLHTQMCFFRYIPWYSVERGVIEIAGTVANFCLCPSQVSSGKRGSMLSYVFCSEPHGNSVANDSAEY